MGVSMDFDLSPATLEGSVPWCIFGGKGVGKTTLSMGLHGEVKVTHLNFDNTAVRIKNSRYSNSKVTVLDAARYINELDMVRTGALTLKYVKELVIANPADVIVVDPLQSLVECAEAQMRQDAKIDTFIKGVEFQVWKQRKFILRELHHFFSSRAKLAVIYVTNEDTKVEKEDFVEKTTRTVPRWMDIIEDQCLVVVHVFTRITPAGMRRFARIESSKLDKPATWELYDISEVSTLTRIAKQEEVKSEW